MKAYRHFLSEILFALLERCAAAGIDIGTKQQVELIPMAGPDPKRDATP